MKAALLAAVVLWKGASANEPPAAQPDAMRYERVIHVPAQTGQACAVLDGQIFIHAAPSLADVRIFPAGTGSGVAREIPYAVTESNAVTEETQAARVLNLGTVGGKIVFDLEMPQRPYTDVKLQIDPAVENFLATATVIGTSVLARGGSSEKSLDLGTFTLFDLTVQHLSRDTTLPLAESTFRYLHVEMSFANAPGAKNETKEGAAARFTPGVVQGAQVPPSREAQIIYTTVAQTTSIATVGRQTRATFEVPMRVPIEQVSFVLPPDFKGNFSRDVRVTALAEASDKDSGDARASLPETMAGTISRVHTTEAGRGIRTDELGIPAILGANLQRPAKVEVAIENGDDRPLPIAAVRLEMRQRKICFDAAAAGVGELGLFYGNPALTAPVYDYERLFAPSEKPLMADLGPETLNASYRAPAEVVRPFAERHPGVLWLALLAVIAALGLVAVRSSRTVVR